MTEVPVSTISTLEEAAIMKFAVLLSTDKEISQLMKYALHAEVPNQRWKNLLRRKISEMALPAHFHKRLISITSRVSLFMEQLKSIHDEISPAFGGPCQCLHGILHSFVFHSSDGVFDERKTVERIVADQRIDVAFRFTLANIFCMESSRVSLQQQLLRGTQSDSSENNWPNYSESRSLVMLIYKTFCFRQTFLIRGGNFLVD
ncbi:hypothetical protein HNY73_018757 [Argiope bruennichi]|uniref:Uncharacterized protein n=1 Tax=Argiope bruennichi TaxID=94029 RepID=A0A8T0EFB2_ARGBR|nr:hypothetical protein HNY73_018757 [Argiope bruennichi]